MKVIFLRFGALSDVSNCWTGSWIRSVRASFSAELHSTASKFLNVFRQANVGMIICLCACKLRKTLKSVVHEQINEES